MGNVCSEKLSLRLPIPLRRQVEAFAEAERRSLSNSVRVLVESGLAVRREKERVG